jgi:exonuclease III
MRILGWNCQGMCNVSTARTFRAIIRVQNPDCIFLCETKASEDCLKKLACSIGFSEHLIVGAKGKAGGIGLFWSNTVSAKIVEFDSRTIVLTPHFATINFTFLYFSA